MSNHSNAHLENVIDCLREAKKVTFIIGAGASLSAGIPSASGFMEKIAQKFPSFWKTLTVTERENYGRVMALLPVNNRRDLIQSYLEHAKLNWGHVALASIVQTFDACRVLSFNFDFLLEQAVSLFGKHLPIYDFGVAPADAGELNELANTAIFHLHGQGYGLKLLNTEEETQEHAEKLKPLLVDSLQNHVTIIAGYSGLADAAFDIMKDAFNARNYLFWLGYEDKPNEHLRPLLAKKYAFYVGKSDFDLTMIKLARARGNCWPPGIISNPPDYVTSLLAPLPNFPVHEEEQTDLLNDTRQKLKQLSDKWNETKGPLGQVETAILSGQSPESSNVDVASSPEIRKMAAWAYAQVGDRFFDEAAVLEGHARRDKLSNAGIQYEKAVHLDPDMYTAFANWGNTLVEEAKILPEKQSHSKFFEAYEKYEKAVSIQSSYNTLYNWGNAINDEANILKGYKRQHKLSEACEKYRQATALEPSMYQAWYNWGNALYDEAEFLHETKRRDKLSEACDKYKRADMINPQQNVILFNWARALTDLACMLEGRLRRDKLSEAYKKYESAVQINPADCDAFNTWGNALREEALVLESDKKYRKFCEACNKYARALQIKPDKHEAFNNWGIVLLDQSRLLEGDLRRKKLSESCEKYASAIQIKSDYHEAFINWADTLLEAACLLKGEARREKLNEACDKYKHALQIKPSDQRALHNLDVALRVQSTFE